MAMPRVRSLANQACCPCRSGSGRRSPPPTRGHWTRANPPEKLNSVAELPKLLAKLAQKAADMAAKAKASTQTVSRVMNAMDKK